MKSIKEISLDISEEEYRQMPELSYSTLAKYERGGGFKSIPTLFDKVESPSLTFGSAVDSIITGGMDEFNDRFIVAEFPSIPDSIITIVKYLFNQYKETNRNLISICDSAIIEATEIHKYQLNWKPETRAKVIKEKGEEYYNLLYISDNKTILSTKDYENVINAVNALKESNATRFYFAEDNPFDNIERQYQLKFNAEFNGVGYRTMMDLVIVDHDNKTILPIDLKTSGKSEYEFYKSFIEWGYMWQAILYTKVLEANIKKDDYFKDFTILPYNFIVVNKFSLCPLVWEYKDNHSINDVKLGDITYRHPFKIGEELYYYLNNNSRVPKGIEINGVNDITKWLIKKEQ